MIGPWDRIEGSAHDDELDAGVEARVADPLWMLARQWQVGELRGDDAARPIAARVDLMTTGLTGYRGGASGDELPMPTAHPLERVVEAAPPPSGGAAGLRWATRLAAQVSRRLRRAGLADAVSALVASGEFELPRDDAVAMPGPGTIVVELLRRRSFDGAALLGATESETAGALAELDGERRSKAQAVIADWRIATRDRFGRTGPDTWDDTRLEHTFAVAARTADLAIELEAEEYLGGHLDWYSFDVGAVEKIVDPPKTSRDKDDPSSPRSTTVTAIPTPVRYAGMPATRWWAFEEGDVHFGDLSAGPGDLGRLLVADYATVYGNDWFSIPLRIPTGSLAQVRSLRVYDTMGGHLDVAPAAVLDRRRTGQRAFRLYELTGDPSVAAGRAPLLFVPPSLSGSSQGPVVEQVELVRDEAANLAWGVERLVEGANGVAVDRLQHWRTTEHRLGRTEPGAARLGPARPGPGPAGPDRPEGPGGGLPGGGLPGDGAPTTVDEFWRYRLETTAPPYWVPFVPVRVGGDAQIRLRRARMQEWELLDERLTGAKGELLQRHQPMVVEEEEIPRGGTTLERRWQVARWTDGSLHVWLQRSKRLGRGERSAGVRWDSLDG